MKRLAVLRHAKSSWANPGQGDHNRSLNERGQEAARRIGWEMKQRGMDVDYVFASTAARVRETLEGVQEKSGLDAEIHFEPGIYLASAETLLTFVRGLPESVVAPLLVGHNPGLQRLIVELTHDDVRHLRHRVAQKYPTGALAIVDLPADRWCDTQPRTGVVADLLFPRDLD